jgi:hypothetical protein
MSQSDFWLFDRLSYELSFDVTLRDDDLVEGFDVYRNSLVVVSESASASSVKNHIAATGMLVLQPSVFPVLNMTGQTPGVHFGSSSNQFVIRITPDPHPLAAGFSGSRLWFVRTTSQRGTYGWGASLPKSANCIAILESHTRCAIFAYERDAVRPDLMPGRRVGWFGQGALYWLTDDGKKLFDAAVMWTGGR